MCVFDGRTMPMKGANLGDNSESAMVAASLRGTKGSSTCVAAGKMRWWGAYMSWKST